MKFFKNKFLFIIDKFRETRKNSKKHEIGFLYTQLYLLLCGAVLLLLGLGIFIALSFVYGTMLFSLISFGLAILFLIVLTAFYCRNKSIKIFLKNRDYFNDYKAMITKYNYLYDGSIKKIPSYLMIGEHGSGKSSLLQKNEMIFSTNENDEKAHSVNWYVNDKLLIWSLPTNKQTSDHSEENAYFSKLSGLVKMLRYNGFFPAFDGIILTVSAEDLITCSNDTVSDRAKKYLETIYYIKNKLSHSLPLYIFITKSDLICGFTRFINCIDSNILRSYFGWVNDPKYIGKKFEANLFKKEMLRIISKIKHDRFRVINKNFNENSRNLNDDINSIFALSENLKNITEKLCIFSKVLTGNNYFKFISKKQTNSMPIFLRGILFASVKQENNYLDSYPEEFEKCLDKQFCYQNNKKLEQKEMFAGGIFTKLLQYEKSLPIYLISIHRRYKMKRLLGWAAVVCFCISLFIISSLYWMHILDMITLESRNYSYFDPDYQDVKYVYPEKTLQFLKAKRKFLYFQYNYSKLINIIKSSENTTISNNISQAGQVLTVPYSGFGAFRIKERFRPKYLSYINQHMEKLEKQFQEADFLEKSEKTNSLRRKVFKAYEYYVDNYLAYWDSVIEKLKPTEQNWKNLAGENVQFWVINSDLKKNFDIFYSALNESSMVLSKNNSFITDSKERALLEKKSTLMLKNISTTISTLNDNKFSQLTEKYYRYWQSLYLDENITDARNKILRLTQSEFLNKAFFEYSRESENIDYCKLYWQQLTKNFLKSLGNAVKASAAEYVNHIQECMFFPLKHNTITHHEMTEKELDEIDEHLNIFWPSKNSFSEDCVGHSAKTHSPELNQLIKNLIPQINANEYKWVKHLREVLAAIHGGFSAKIYLIPSDRGYDLNTASEKWIFLCLDDLKNKNIPVRTRDDEEKFLGKIKSSQPLIDFVFYRTDRNAMLDKNGLELKLNGRWSILKLLSKGPDRPQNYDGNYWVTWKFIKKLNDRNYLTRLSFIDKDNKKLNFYLRLNFSENLDSVFKI